MVLGLLVRENRILVKSHYDNNNNYCSPAGRYFQHYFDNYTLAPIDIEPITEDMLDHFAVIGGEEEEEEDSSRTPTGEESRRRRRRERSSIRASSSSSPRRRRRRRVSGTTTPTSPASARLIGTTDLEEAQDVFPVTYQLSGQCACLCAGIR